VISLSLLLAQAVANLSLSQVQDMSPEAAGDAVLNSQPHGPIEIFEAPTGGMLPPGMIEGQLIERATTAGSACVRRVWTVKFRAEEGAAIASAKAESFYSGQEIALSANGICPSGRYVHLNPSVNLGQGREALENLAEITSHRSRTAFRCSDDTPFGLCKGDSAILAAIRHMKPWLINSSGGDIRILLGKPGSAVTEVRFKAGQPSRVSINRRTPAPF
jgi:hypothetical protein